jgi:type I restriction enzyme R subunit
MNATKHAASPNFGFLAKRYPQLERIGARSDRYFSEDPIVSLITIRQFGEALAQLVAARSGLYTDANEPQSDLLRRLRVDGNYPPSVLDLFHQLRIDGNAATHQHVGDHAKALACLKMAPQLGILFYRTFENHNFKDRPISAPRPPSDATTELTAELSRLRAERDGSTSAVQRAKAAAADAEAAQLAAETGARGVAEERELWGATRRRSRSRQKPARLTVGNPAEAAEGRPAAEQRQVLGLKPVR